MYIGLNGTSYELRCTIALLIDAKEEGYIGEPVSQYMHALQTAYLARRIGGSDAVVVAALFHDIGHLCAPFESPEMKGLGILHHEDIGADHLKKIGFNPVVVDVVRNHVNAKRFLCWKSSRYYEKLSDASKGTLAFQGGPMSDEEARAFEQHPRFHDRVLIRIAEDNAKRLNQNMPPIQTYFPLLRKCLS